jgi:hypothetical protein
MVTDNSFAGAKTAGALSSLLTYVEVYLKSATLLSIF